MAINYLDGTTQMEIRPASNDGNDVLFEMETSEFTNICCRVDTSYDLVVRDVASGAILFCINGAEIENHPVRVYANGPIGWIEDEKINLMGSGSEAVKIKGSQSRYNINRAVVKVMSGRVKIDWPQNVSNEMKVMTIAFALNISLTKHKTTVIKRVSTARRQPRMHHLVDLHRHLDAPATPEVIPQRNRPRARSMFPRTTHDQRVRLTMVGNDPKMKQKLAFLMDEDGKVLLLIKKDGINEFNVHKTTVQKSDGVAEFTLHTTQYREIKLVLCDVEYRGRNIGKVRYSGLTQDYTLTDLTGRGGRTVINSTPINPETIDTIFFDCDGNVFGEMNTQFYTALEIRLSARVSPVMKKLIICAAIVYYGRYFKHFEECPQVTIKPQTCKCSQCLQQVQISVPYQLPHDHTIFNCMDLKIKPAGHTKTKNITYCDVFRQPGGEVLCTLEVTPIKNFEGVAKVVCKSRNGCTLFTSLHSPTIYLILIYNSEDTLVGYIKNNQVFDWQNKLALKIGKGTKAQTRAESQLDLSDKYRLYRPDTNRISEISSNFRCMTIHRPHIAAMGLSGFELFVELTLAAIFQSEPNKIDRIPTPEIVYCYGS